jgi:hypothetical protein
MCGAGCLHATPANHGVERDIKLCCGALCPRRPDLGAVIYLFNVVTCCCTAGRLGLSVVSSRVRIQCIPCHGPAVDSDCTLQLFMLAMHVQQQPVQARVSLTLTGPVEAAMSLPAAHWYSATACLVVT